MFRVFGYKVGNKSDEELLNNRHKNRGHNTSALYK